MAGLNKVTLVTRNLWRKLRDMSAFTTVTVKISKTKISGRNLVYRRRTEVEVKFSKIRTGCGSYLK